MCFESMTIKDFNEYLRTKAFNLTDEYEQELRKQALKRLKQSYQKAGGEVKVAKEQIIYDLEYEPRFSTMSEVSETYPRSEVKNGNLRSINFRVIGHFGNIPVLEMPIDTASSSINFGADANCIASAGIIMKTLIELFNLTSDNGVGLRDLVNIPVRIAVDNTVGGRAVAIGNYLDDKFITVNELVNGGLIVNNG